MIIENYKQRIKPVSPEDLYRLNWVEMLRSKYNIGSNSLLWYKCLKGTNHPSSDSVIQTDHCSSSHPSTFVFKPFSVLNKEYHDV